jgi:hypothetical protein
LKEDGIQKNKPEYKKKDNDLDQDQRVLSGFLFTFELHIRSFYSKNQVSLKKPIYFQQIIRMESIIRRLLRTSLMLSNSKFT